MAEHRVEEGVKVYLEWDEPSGQWHVAPSTMDGHALDSTRERGASCDFTHEQGGLDELECEALLEAADRQSLPSGQELVVLLTEHLSGSDKIDVIRDVARQL